MADIELNRIYQDEFSTLGILLIGRWKCFTLELPWRDNKKNESCIPGGEYKYIKRLSPSRGLTVIELVDVPGRSYVQIHPGNFTTHTLGCILPGMGLKDINHDGVCDVTNSRAAFDKIMALAPDSGVIEICY